MHITHLEKANARTLKFCFISPIFFISLCQSIYQFSTLRSSVITDWREHWKIRANNVYMADLWLQQRFLLYLIILLSNCWNPPIKVSFLIRLTATEQSIYYTHGDVNHTFYPWMLLRWNPTKAGQKIGCYGYKVTLCFFSSHGSK